MVLLWALVQQASSCNSCSKSFRDLVLWLTQASLSQGPRNPRPISHSSLLEQGQEDVTSPLKAQGKAKGIGLLGNLSGQQNDATILSEDINQGKNSHVLGSKSNIASMCIRMRNRHLTATTAGGLRATHCQQMTIFWHPFKRI